jgi:hypothetical protein
MSEEYDVRTEALVGMYYLKIWTYMYNNMYQTIN